MKGKLVLANGCVFYGDLLGETATVGEVVFNTGMTGYQEILTDPSYAGQIITLTYPLVGNYGTFSAIEQAKKCHCNGFIIGELCEHPNNWQMDGNLNEYLKKEGITCLYNVDTRAITRAIRSQGVMKGILVPAEYTDEECKALMEGELSRDLVKKVTVQGVEKEGEGEFKVAVIDFGVKRSILDGLLSVGCELTIFPATVKAEEVLKVNPDGIFLSNGPGDPKDLSYAIEEVKKLLGKKPIFGICMGHHVTALALGGDTYKMVFGHRGSNHPVQDLRTGRVYITSQNHGYAVDEISLSQEEVEITHRSVNDNTVEGLRHKKMPIMTVQYHPEASPGPTDNTYLFDEFKAMMKGE